MKKSKRQERFDEGWKVGISTGVVFCVLIFSAIVLTYITSVQQTKQEETWTCTQWKNENILGKSQQRVTWHIEGRNDSVELIKECLSYDGVLTYYNKYNTFTCDIESRCVKEGKNCKEEEVKTKLETVEITEPYAKINGKTHIAGDIRVIIPDEYIKDKDMFPFFCDWSGECWYFQTELVCEEYRTVM